MTRRDVFCTVLGAILILALQTLTLGYILMLDQHNQHKREFGL